MPVTRRLAALAGRAVGGAAALALAWLVLVTLRSGAPTTTAGGVPGRLDAGIARTLAADRVLAVATWAGYVSTTLVLGGLLFGWLVRRPRSERRAARSRGRAHRTAGSRAHSGTDTDGSLPTRRPSRRPDTLTDGSLPTRHRGLGPDAGESVLRAAVALGLLAVAVSIPLRAAVVSGRGLAALGDPEPLALVLASPFGDAAVLRAAGLGLVAASRVGGPLRGVTAVSGAAIVLASYLVVGHPQANDPAALEVGAQAVHVTAVSAWFGGIVFLAAELRQRRREGSVRASALVVGRFSRMAEAAVVLVLASGVVLAEGQVPLATAFWSTAYGRALVAKLAFVAVVLAVGGYNRQRVVPAIAERDDEAAWRRLRVTCAVESTVVALGVLRMTAAMTSGGF